MGCVFVPPTETSTLPVCGVGSICPLAGGVCLSSSCACSSGCPEGQLSSLLTARLFATYSLIQILNMLFPLSKGCEGFWTKVNGKPDLVLGMLVCASTLYIHICAYCRCWCAHGIYSVKAPCSQEKEFAILLWTEQNHSAGRY